jgi:hypothetical protein
MAAPGDDLASRHPSRHPALPGFAGLLRMGSEIASQRLRMRTGEERMTI